MAAAVSGRVSQRPIYAIWYIRYLLSLLFHLIGDGPAQHPALANGIGSLIDQKFRIVFQWSVVNSIWIEGPSIPQSRFIKCTTLRSIQKAHTQIFSGSCDNKMGTILSTDQAGGSLSLAAPEDDLHMEHRPVFICPNHAVSLLWPVPLFSLNRQTA